MKNTLAIILATLFLSTGGIAFAHQYEIVKKCPDSCEYSDNAGDAFHAGTCTPHKGTGNTEYYTCD